MKKIKILTAAVLSVCLFTAVFSACDKKTSGNQDATASSTQPVSSPFPTNEAGTAYSVGADGYRYYIYDAPTAENKENTESNQTGHTVMTLTTGAKTTKKAENKIDESTQKNETTVKSNTYDETVKNENKGIAVLSKTPSVPKGSSASVTIMGQAGKSYSIEFYKDASSLASADGLSSKTADSNGLVTWTFEIGYDCEAGNRKIIIKEKGSDNFVQTSITVK